MSQLERARMAHETFVELSLLMRDEGPAAVRERMRRWTLPFAEDVVMGGLLWAQDACRQHGELRHGDGPDERRAIRPAQGAAAARRPGRGARAAVVKAAGREAGGRLWRRLRSVARLAWTGLKSVGTLHAMGASLQPTDPDWGIRGRRHG